MPHNFSKRLLLYFFYFYEEPQNFFKFTNYILFFIAKVKTLNCNFGPRLIIYNKFQLARAPRGLVGRNVQQCCPRNAVQQYTVFHKVPTIANPSQAQPEPSLTRASPTQASPTRANLNRASPTRASSTRASPIRANPIRASPI